MIQLWKEFLIALTFLTSMTGISLPDDLLHNLPKVEEESNDLTEEWIFTQTEKIMEQLVQPTDEEYRVLHFNNKQQLVDSFLPYASKSFAQKLVDLYYEERNGALYIIPTETPPWFVPQTAYTIQKISPDQYNVIQTNESELYGRYTITLHFKRNNHGIWIVDDVTYPTDKDPERK